LKLRKYIITFFIVLLIFLNAASIVFAKKSKFYDFSEQIINGDIKKPATLYTDARKKVQFEQLLKLKKSFMHELFETGKERIFR